jgi:hypothetical protein
LTRGPTSLFDLSLQRYLPAPQILIESHAAHQGGSALQVKLQLPAKVGSRQSFIPAGSKSPKRPSPAKAAGRAGSQRYSDGAWSSHPALVLPGIAPVILTRSFPRRQPKMIKQYSQTSALGKTNHASYSTNFVLLGVLRDATT